MTGANIENLVEKFKPLTNEERWVYLGVILEGKVKTKADLTWRAHFVTALREADLYPVNPEHVNPDDLI